MAPCIPNEADFSALAPSLNIALHFPSPPESTTAFLILFHGLGDHEVPFTGFAEGLALPGVMGISVRGTSLLPASLLPDGMDENSHFHWGDDLTLDPATGDLDEDPGFNKAAGLVMNRLIKETLIQKCGWELNDIMLFGFGQGGSLALGLAAKLATGDRVVDVTEEPARGEGKEFKGVVSLGGPLPLSMVSSVTAREKSKTGVLICQLDEEQEDLVKREFEDVTTVRWKRRGVGMPRDRDEVLPIMKFFGDKLSSGL